MPLKEVTHLPTIELPHDFSTRRKVASIPGVRFDTVDHTYVLDTEKAGEYGRNLAKQLFPELSHRIDTAQDPVHDFRPIDLATPWAESIECGPSVLKPAHPSHATALTKLLGPDEYVPEHLKKALYPFQAVDVAYIARRLEQDGCGYLGWEPGLGKTFAALVAAMAVGARRIVCVVPNASKLAVWAREIPKWSVDRWRVFNLAGTKAQRDRVMREFNQCQDAILLIHYEALRLVDWSFTTRVKTAVDLVICDEAHRLSKGGPGGKAPQFYRSLKHIKARMRLALSGSIIVNSPEDLFGALHWLAPQVYGSRWKDWNNRFIAYADGPWGKIMLGLKAEKLDEMRDELAQILCVRRKVDELPGLPEKIEITRFVELSPEQRRVYDDMAERFVAELPDGQVLLAPQVIVQLGKLRQIATGLDLLGDTMQDSAKLDLALEMVESNLPRKTVVFAWHKATVHAMAERLHKAGVPCLHITGDTKAETRAEYVQSFQSNPDVKVMVATIKTLGESVTLHAASDLIFLEQSWTPTDMQQAADRIHRIGQEAGRVSITTIAAKDTVDEHKVIPTLKSKEDLRALVLGGNR